MKWYVANDEKRSTRQLVIEVPTGNAKEPKFGMIMLPGKYQETFANQISTGFFRMSGDPLPFMMARADKCVATLKDQPFRMAYSFYRMPSGGLFGIFLEFESEQLGKATQSGFPIIEMTYGLDVQETRTLALEGPTRQPAHIVFAEGSSSGHYVSINPYTGERSSESSMPQSIYDRVFELPGDFIDAFKKEYDSLLSYHRNCRQRDYQQSMRQLCELFPLSAYPILRANESPSTAKKGKASAASKWWQFWK